MREIVTESIEEHSCSSKVPNKKTFKAIADIEAGKDLITAKDAKDLFEKLGI